MKLKSLFLTFFFVSCSVNQAYSSNKVFSISSKDIENREAISNKHVFRGFGCEGENISPQINWKHAPKNTKSFALTVYDPDAPTGSGWWHWVVVNIPANYKKLPTDFGAENKFQLADGMVQIRNDFGIYQFGGPCPPKGDKPHRYIFTIYALKTNKIDLSENSTAALAGFVINQGVIAKASFEARYGR
jgi:Raf kinase inhibitor-like YbhB/YbcL family protein